MRSACLGRLVLLPVLSPVLLPVLGSGCGAVVDRTPFRPEDDLQTTTPRNLAEAGHSVVAPLPAGVRFHLELAAVRETPRKAVPVQHYELLLAVSCAGDDPWRADVHGVELVDDESLTLRPSQVLRRAPGSGSPTGSRSYRLVFELPGSYRPRRIGRVTVHWALVAPGHPPVRISSRFRR